MLLFVIAIAFAFPLAAGGSSESDEEALEFWCYWDKGHPNDLWMRQIIDDFEKETGIKVNYSNPGANILLSVAPAIVDGNAPDLIDGHCIEMIASLGNDGLLLPLEDLYSGTTWDGSGTFESQFIEGTTTQGMYDGERWFVPYCAHTSCFHYNKAEFEKHGMACSGINPESDLVEIIEIPTLKWYIGVQFHPEYSSTILHPHPLFLSFVKAAVENQK